MLRIVHITVVRKLSLGQEKQLRWEHAAAVNLDTAHWETLVFQDGPSSAPFVKRVPFLLRGLLLRNLYAWMLVLKLSHKNDIVLMRHISFDPFSFIFAPLISNRIGIHHAKEVEALLVVKKGWKGRCASLLEQLSGRHSVQHALAILAVTNEIAQYQINRVKIHKPVNVYPNGINLNQVKILSDKRVDGEINICFLCGKFSEWQGLDKLIKAVEDFAVDEVTATVYIHLIGYLSASQIANIQAVNSKKIIFRSYGLLSECEYRPILDKCDFGLASLAIEREGLREASTLKVREMLALGMPVYSNHEDTALDASVPFIKIIKDLDVLEMIEFGMCCKRFERAIIREDSQIRIGKLSAMKMVVNFIEKSVLRSDISF